MKEFYVNKPAEIEVYPHGGVSDIILRKNIAQEQDEDGGERWVCEERQVKYSGNVSFAAIEKSFNDWWTTAGGGEPLITIKEKKIAEMSTACREAIIEGFDVILSDGKKRHFSMTVEDQLNINSLYGLLSSGMTAVPYHADGDACEYFSADDFQIIAQMAASHKTFHESYFNSLKTFINSKRTASTIEAITYGVVIPEQYQSDVLKALQEA